MVDINDFYLKTNKLSDANSSVNLPTANNSQMLNSSITYSQLNSSSVFKESALILLKRLIGCMGNLNSIKDPSIHRKVFEFLFTKWEKLGKVNRTLSRTINLIVLVEDLILKIFLDKRWPENWRRLVESSHAAVLFRAVAIRSHISVAVHLPKWQTNCD